MLLLPTIVVPMLMNFMIKFVVKAEKKASTETLTYTVIGSENLPDLAGAFTEDKGFKKVEISSQEEIASAIEEEKIKFGLVIPQTAREQIEAGEQVTIDFYYSDVSVASKVKNRTKKIIQELSDKYRSERLKKFGMDTTQAQEHLLNPITIEEHNTANLRAMLGERVGGMLPYIFIIFCICSFS